ncbi:hypothetical protein GCM10010261_41710 [Streptomyces pilosus]|nr:hypothetical protein GCM10010261_41710 [Streptomyces pilosus]
MQHASPYLETGGPVLYKPEDNGRRTSRSLGTAPNGISGGPEQTGHPNRWRSVRSPACSDDIQR